MDLVTRFWETLVISVGASDVVMLALRLTAIGAAGHLVMVLLRRSSAAIRHLVAIATLSIMVATPWLGMLGADRLELHVPMWMPEATTAARTRAILRPLELTNETDIPAGPSTAAGEALAASEVWKTKRAAEAMALEPEIAPAHAVAAGSAAADPRHQPWRAWPAAAVALAIGIALGLLAARLVALASIAWVARRARDVEAPRILAAFARAAATVGMRRPVELRWTSQLDVPAVAGFPRPVLLLPSHALEWSDARLLPVLLHELAHLQRRDGVGLAVSQVATALLWFHPLAWTLARAARQECERACDDVVLEAGVRPSEYADQLLSIAHAATRPERWTSMSLAFARPSSLEGRLLSILRADVRRSPLTRRVGLGVAFGLVALLLPFAAVRVVAEPYSAKSPSKWPRVRVATVADSRTETCTNTCTETQTITTAKGETYTVSENGAHELTCPADDQTSEADFPDVGPADAKDGEAWYRQAKSEYDAAQYQASAESYERAAQAGKDCGTTWYNAACSWALAGEKNRALGALHHAIKRDSEVVKWIESDDDFASMREDRRFRMLRDAALQKEEPSVEAAPAGSKWKDDEEDEAEAYDRDDPGDLRAAGIRLMRTGRPERAAAMFQNQYAIDSSATALYNTACAWAIAKQPARALDYLERSIYAGYGDEEKLQEDDDLNSLHRQKRFDELVQLAADLDMDYPRGNWSNVTGDDVSGWKRLMPRYERVAQEYPRAGRAWWNLGFAALRAEDPETSRRAYLKALSLGYRRGVSNYNLACAAAQLGDEDEALRRLEMAEAAGMDVEQIAPGDSDLDPLRRNSKFRSMVRSWDDEKSEKKRKHDRDKQKDKDWERKDG